jgi:maleylpyruvate isomerase
MTEIVGHHLRDVEVHHVDLDVGYSPADWPAELVAGELDRRLRGLPGRADPAELLAWLLDRGPAPGLGPW